MTSWTKERVLDVLTRDGNRDRFLDEVLALQREERSASYLPILNVAKRELGSWEAVEKVLS